MEYIGAIFGFFLGVATGWLFFRQRATQGSQATESLQIELQTNLNLCQNQLMEKEEKNDRLSEKNIELEKALSREQAQRAPLNILKDQWTQEFKNLSQNILDDNTKKFQTLSEGKLNHLLTPFKESMKLVQEKINENNRDQFSLKEQIKQLNDTHLNLKDETKNLTRALKGDVKAQGKWGEMILDKVLEFSGLKEGVHYKKEAKGLHVKSEEGRTQRPDVIVKLPNKKDIIIDAKVSLTHYEEFISTNEEEEKAKKLSLFVNSIRMHVKGLSEKNYPLAKGLDATDLVLMFFPIEGAFSLALQKDPKIFSDSWRKAIVIVSPTTLLATLRTIGFLWQREQINKNAKELARQGGLLYDKFVSFSEDLKDVGKHIQKTKEAHEGAFQKLNSGRGNIVSKLETIKKLGARTSKQIPEHLSSSLIEEEVN